MEDRNKRIAIFGSNGMLGRDAKTFLMEKGYDVFGFSRNDADVTDSTAVSKLLDKIELDYILNCAGWTDVDGAESHRKKAMNTNGKAVKILAETCKKKEIFFIHISSDYVFAGNKKDGYIEQDKIGPPINIYGESKILGENMIIETLPEKSYLICRTQWLYGQHDRNFVNRVANDAMNNRNIYAVVDQEGVLTSTNELCSQICWLLANIKSGIAHTVGGGGPISWYDAGCEIIKILDSKSEIIPVKWKELKKPAKRPEFGWLINSRFPDMPVRDWKESLKSYLKKINSNKTMQVI